MKDTVFVSTHYSCKQLIPAFTNTVIAAFNTSSLETPSINSASSY